MMNDEIEASHSARSSYIIHCSSVVDFMKIQLVKLAHARSGDKGDTANVGLIALKEEHYPLLAREVRRKGQRTLWRVG